MKCCVDCGKILSSNRPVRCKRCSLTFKWSDESYRRKSSNSFKNAATTNPELRRGRSERAKRQWSGGEESKLRQAIAHAREQGHFAGMLAAAHAPEAVAKQSASMRLRWQDPEYVKLFKERQAAGMATPEARANRSAATSRRWANPYQRKRLLDGMFGVFNLEPSGLELLVMRQLDKLSVSYQSQYRPVGLHRFYNLLVQDYGLLIEVDGEFWHHSDWAAANGVTEVDSEKNEWAISNGYFMARLREIDINTVGGDTLVTSLLEYIRHSNLPAVLIYKNGMWVSEPRQI